MKKRLHILLGLLIVLITGCDVNDKFDGLDDMTKPHNLTSYKYQLVPADYTVISNAALKVATNNSDTLKARSINTYKAFSDRVLAADYIPFFLNSTYKYCDVGSTATITYSFGQNKPSFVIVSKSDYQYLWGDSFLNYVEAFTPAKSPDANLNAVLKNKYPSAIEGDYKFLEYNYSSVDADTNNIEYKYFYDDFEAHTYLPSPYSPISEFGWTQRDTSGSRSWLNRLSSTNHYAQATSFGSTELNNVFLITKQVDLTQAIAPQFTFDVAVGYWNANCLQILISENYSGNVADIGTATWTDITSTFTLPETPTTSYGTLSSAGVADFTPYVGKKVYIAFKYSGDDRATTSPKITTTYRIDNVKVSEMRDALSITSSEMQYVAYTFDGSDWVKSGDKFDVVQPADYTAMGLTFISSANVPIYIPTFLKQKYPYALEGDMRNVVYLSSATARSATQFVYTNGVWVANDFVIEETALFKLKPNGWVFVDSDILVGLNTSTKMSSNLGDFTIIDVQGAQTWTWDNTYGAKITGYASGYFNNEDWLVSPAMNLSERGDSIFLTFKHAGNYFTNSATMKQYAKVMISTKSDGTTINSADWTELPLALSDYPAGSNWTYVATKPIKLSAYKGESNVRIAFKYRSTASPDLAGTWEILNVYVYEKEE